MTNTDALTEVVRELIRDKGDRVHEWPEDEAAAYRDNGGFAEGRAAVEKCRVAKGVAAVEEAVVEEVRKAQAAALRAWASGVESQLDATADKGIDLGEWGRGLRSGVQQARDTAGRIEKDKP